MGRIINTEELNIVDKGYLIDWFINSVSENDTPVWTEEHIDELVKDYYCIPIYCIPMDKPTKVGGEEQ